MAADFLTIEAWTRRGLRRFVILFFMELSTRKVEIAGIASSPSGLWMNQVGRNLTDAVDAWSVDRLSDRTATGLYIRGRSPENGESHVARVDRQNPAREQSRRAFQLVAACLTRTRRGKVQNVCGDSSADFFTVEVWTRRGVQRFLVLFFIELSMRRVKIAGVAAQANGLWMSQIGRDISDPVDGLFRGKRYLIHDRYPLFTAEFQDMLSEVGIQSVKLPPRSLNLNAHAERFVRTIKESCLDRLILFGEGGLRKAIREFVAHYHQERNHQGSATASLLPRLARRRMVDRSGDGSAWAGS